MDQEEQAVIVYFDGYSGGDDLDLLFELEEELEKVIEEKGVGEYDGNEIASEGDDGSLYMYGPDADKLLEAVKPTLDKADIFTKVEAVVRYGPPQEGVKEKLVKLKESR